MMLDLLGYFFPGGPYFTRRKAARRVKVLESGGEVIIEAIQLSSEKKVLNGYLRLALPSIWWRPNREISVGEVLICRVQCPISMRPVDENSYRRGVPKYWTLVDIVNGDRQTTVAVAEDYAKWLMPIFAAGNE